jgi:hypothetical protein
MTRSVGRGAMPNSAKCWSFQGITFSAQCQSHVPNPAPSTAMHNRSCVAHFLPRFTFRQTALRFAQQPFRLLLRPNVGDDGKHAAHLSIGVRAPVHRRPRTCPSASAHLSIGVHFGRAAI